MIALMYAESRLPGVTRLDFAARWRRHGGVALSYPSFRAAVTRYVHRDPVGDLTMFPGADARYDALGEIVARDAATLTALLNSPDLVGPIRDDGAETFARTRTVNAIVEEHYVRDEYLAPVSVSSFLAARGDRSQFLTRARELQATLCESLPALDARVRRVGVSATIEPQARWATYLDLAFDSVKDAAAAYAVWQPAFAQALGRELAEQITLVTVRCGLYDPCALLVEGWG